MNTKLPVVLLCIFAAVGLAQRLGATSRCQPTTQKKAFDDADIVAKVKVTGRHVEGQKIIYDIRYIEVFKPKGENPQQRADEEQQNNSTQGQDQQQHQNGTNPEPSQQQGNGTQGQGQNQQGNGSQGQQGNGNQGQNQGPLPAQLSTPAVGGATGLVTRNVEYLIAGKRENNTVAITQCSGIPPRDNQFGTPLGALRWNLVNKELENKLKSGQF
ncbi:hypothetical protein M3Y98_00122200 [Aphelenchoides besseyi]|nr:hypothetical protein M3Y98_00122200 [Aphelenchoides besseyi]KAI6199519.1 hypothetical protein M3Y96_00635900 [Aphelenchoides besseyi]